MYDGMATEFEVVKFLKALVRVLKPTVIVETGCYLGYGTEALVKGAIQNGFGHVYTCDMDKTMIDRTQERLVWAGDWVEVQQRPGLELINSLNLIDFAFIDSAPDQRTVELEAVYPRLPDWGIAAIHDTGETHPDIREKVFDTIRELRLKSIHFGTPRGLTLVGK